MVLVLDSRGRGEPQPDSHGPHALLALPENAMARPHTAQLTALAAALVSMTAWAGPRDEALAAIAAGDLKTAKKAIGTLDDHLGNKKKLVRAEVLSRRYLTEALYHEARGKQDDVLAALRQACLVHPGSDPDESIIGDGALVDMFYAVCGEVKQRPEVDMAALKLPDAPVRIDGAVPGEEYALREGRHLVQVQCENGNWSTRWSELTKAEDWGEGCPNGALAAAAPPESDDVVDAVMPSFLGGMGDGDMGDEDLGDGDMGDGDMGDGDMGEDAVEEDVDGLAAAPAPVPPPPPPDAAALAQPGPDTMRGTVPDQPEPADPPPPAARLDGYRLVVECVPTPCTVRVDGEVVGESPLDTRLDAGMYDFSLKAGPNSMTRKLSLSADHPTTTVTWDHKKGEWKLDQPRMGK